MTKPPLHLVKAENDCPLCANRHCDFYFEDKKRAYFQCTSCQLVFVPESFVLSPELEKAEYDKHDNSQLDEGYRRFLLRTLTPLLQCLEQRSQPLNRLTGLDFGCGEGAFFSEIARQYGLQIENYDLYYHPAPEKLQQPYDVIVMTEVIEHLARPAEVLSQLRTLLKPGGMFAIMTKRVLNKTAFSTWHYKNDPTHICFYSEYTFNWLATALNMTANFVEKDVVLLCAK